MKKTKSLYFILVVVLLIWPINYLIHGLQKQDPNAERITEIIQSDVFLMGLNGKHGEGCIALKYMQDVDIIIIGSSHSYAAIDPYVLQQNIEGKRVGICAISSWNTDYLHEFMQFLNRENISPKRIIWMADLAVPITLGLHEKRFENAKAILSDTTTQLRISDKWLAKTEEGLPPLGISKDAYKNRQTFHGNALSALSLTAVKERLDTFTEVRDGNIIEVLKTARINPANEKNLRRFCTDLKLRGIDLEIVLPPIPDRTASLFSQHGPKFQYTDLSSFLDANLPCLKGISSESLIGWGLDERYFINRSLYDDHPYEIWNTPDEFGPYYTNLRQALKPRFYSPDHLNPVGAVIFTKELAQLIDK